MNAWHFTPVVIIYLIAIGISLILLLLALRIKTVRGTRLFSAMMFFITLWITSSMLNIFNTYEPWKILMIKVEYLSIGGAVYLWLFFVAVYTQYDKWIRKYMYVLFAIIPVFTLISVIQAPNNSFVHKAYEFEYVNGLKTNVKNFTIGFYIWTAYSYLMLVLGFMFLLFRILETPKAYRKQLYYLTPIVFIVIIPNVLYIIDKNPIEPYDPTPLSLVAIGALIILTMYFHKFLNVAPIANELILNNIKGGVIALDLNNRITDVNSISIAIIGKRKNDILGKRLTDIMPEVACLLDLAKGKEDFKTELKLGPEKRYYELKIAHLIDKPNLLKGHVLMFWDITDQKMAMIELDAYARTVAHDLKNPLGQIMGLTQLLQSSPVTVQENNEYLEAIMNGGDKMRNIIDGLLMLAKIRNQDKLEKSVLNMAEIQESVMRRTLESIDKSKAEVTLPISWHKALGNSLWIEEVWINLLSNAIKYGGEPPVIELGSEEIDGHVKFWISDNGHGMSTDEQSYLFSEFKRMHPNKDKIKGHGLGLSIVQRVISKLGGEVGVDSKIGLGSTFYFTLPSANNNL
jgi:signal transduction histidine kinase